MISGTLRIRIPRQFILEHAMETNPNLQYQFLDILFHWSALYSKHYFNILAGQQTTKTR